MKKLISLGISLALLSALSCQKPANQEDLRIWRDFVDLMKKGEFPAEKILPLHEDLVEPLLGFLKQMRELADWKEWDRAPEVVKGDGAIHYITPLTYANTINYSFSFLIKDGDWFLQHFETIYVRLDQVTSLPTSEFPDMPEDRKIVFREEQYWSRAVRLFNTLSALRTKEEALDYFKDGYGYLVSARAQVPYVPAHRAFILFLCWDLANFRGNDVTLEILEDTEAKVGLELISFGLYEAAAHLKQQISLEDYKKIFETIWLDRAEKAGWTLEIQYLDNEVLFNFKRQT